jgi:hypothetical protein
MGSHPGILGHNMCYQYVHHGVADLVPQVNYIITCLWGKSNLGTVPTSEKKHDRTMALLQHGMHNTNV